MDSNLADTASSRLLRRPQRQPQQCATAASGNISATKVPRRELICKALWQGSACSPNHHLSRSFFLLPQLG